jgi:hypothetical protein
MLLTGALTVWFNLQHAGSDPGRRLAAALPPVLMMLAFEIDVQIVKWVMAALGKPLGPIAPPPAGDTLAGPVPSAIWRSDADGWNLPPAGSPNEWSQSIYGPVPAGHHLPENSHNGPTGLTAGAGRDPAAVTKRQRIEEYLDWLGPEELQHLTVRELTADLAGQGLEVTERYVKQILDSQRPTPQPRRKRGSGARKPRR